MGLAHDAHQLFTDFIIMWFFCIFGVRADMTLATTKKYEVESIDEFIDELDASLEEMIWATIEEGSATEELVLDSARENAGFVDGNPIDHDGDGDPDVTDVHDDLLREFLATRTTSILHTLEARDRMYDHTTTNRGDTHIIKEILSVE